LTQIVTEDGMINSCDFLSYSKTRGSFIFE
jgi:hypothetical protein